MKTLWGGFCCGGVLVTAVVAQVAHTATSHFVANGDRGEIFFSEVDPGAPVPVPLSVQLSVHQTGNGSDLQTILAYIVVRCTEISCDVTEGGVGPIPNHDLSGNGDGVLRLSTNTAENPNFAFSAGSGGHISIEWRPTKIFSQTFSGSRETFIAQPFPDATGSLTIREHGTVSRHWATAQGSIVGVEIPRVGQYGAYVGVDRQVTIENCGPGVPCQ
jgi:hypothetical protein